MAGKIDFDGDFANEYDDVSRKVIPAHDSIYELTQHLLRDKLGKEARILVAGAGTGKEIIDCSKNNPHWSFTGFDPAELMLSLARKKVAAASLENKISFVLGQIDDITGKNFDAATSILVMQFLPDNDTKLDYLKGIADKLKPGAPIILVDLEGEIGSDEFNTLNAAWKNRQLFVKGEIKGDLEKEEALHLVPQKRIVSLLEEAGFVNIHKFFKAYHVGGYIAARK